MFFLALFQNGMGQEMKNPSWRLSFPHVLVATISSFLFGYHIGFVHHLELLLNCNSFCLLVSVLIYVHNLLSCSLQSSQ